MDFDAPPPAAISAMATPSGSTASLGAARTGEAWRETTKHTKYTKAPIAFFRVPRVFRGFISPFGGCFLVLVSIDTSPFFDSLDRRLGGGRVARPQNGEAAQERDVVGGAEKAEGAEAGDIRHGVAAR